jgi:hypothetical protein
MLAFASVAVQAAAQTLAIGIGGSPSPRDPHFDNASPNARLTQHLSDRLGGRTLGQGRGQCWRNPGPRSNRRP